MKNLTLPLNNTQIKSLKAGEVVSLSGKVYTARDAAHKRFFELIDAKKELPFDLNCSAIYYCGISPAKDNEIIGACGPTTSARMDFYTPLLLQRGLKVMIGKGKRSDEVNKAIKENGADAVNQNLEQWLEETSRGGCGDDITMIIAWYGAVVE